MGLLLFRQRGVKARELLLTQLGQASRLNPGIEDSLRTKSPEGYRWMTRELTTSWSDASRFEEAGFGVLLPAWWSRNGTKQRLTLRAGVKSPALKSGAGLNLDRLVDVDWEVALGDEELSLEELGPWPNSNRPLVKLRGQWVQLNAHEIEATLAFWKHKAAGSLSLKEIVRLALAAGQSEAATLAAEPANGSPPLPVARVHAAGWVADLLTRLKGGSPLRISLCRPALWANFARISCGATPGSPSCGAGGWGPAWPTTWGWARPSRPWP